MTVSSNSQSRTYDVTLDLTFLPIPTVPDEGLKLEGIARQTYLVSVVAMSGPLAEAAQSETIAAVVEATLETEAASSYLDVREKEPDLEGEARQTYLETEVAAAVTEAEAAQSDTIATTRETALEGVVASRYLQTKAEDC